MRKIFIIALASIVAGVLLAAIYWPGLHGGFFFDDEPNLHQQEGVRLERLDGDSLWQALTSGRSGPSGRPVAQLSFALNYYISGFEPFAFKATNLAVHAACGVVVLFLGLRLFGGRHGPQQGKKTLLAASLLSALWLLHPIQVTAVLHVVQRMTSLSALFLLTAFLLHVLARERGGRVGALRLALAWGVCWPLSFLSKETGVLFPLFALSWELIVRRSRRDCHDAFTRGFAVLTGLTFAAGVAYALLPAGQWLWAAYAWRDFSPTERLLTEARVLWFYIGLVLFPHPEALGLYHDDIAVSTGPFDPWTTLPALAGLAGLGILVWWLRRRQPLVAFGIAWFLAGHALESSVLPLEIAHEHRNYVPLFGLMLAGVSLMLRFLERERPRSTIAISLTAAVLFYFPFVTALRAHQYGDEVRRTQIEAQHHRGSARAQYEAGRTLASLPEASRPETPVHSFARAHYVRAGELDEKFKLSWLGLIHLDCRAGRPADAAWLDELARRLQGTPFAPGDGTAMHAMKEMAISGELCLARPDVERLFAAAHANPSVSNQVHAMLHSWLADYLVLRTGDLRAAKAELDRALAIAPLNPSNRLKRAQLDFLSGRLDESARALQELRQEPLLHSEKRTVEQLLECLAPGGPTGRCSIRQILRDPA